MYKVTIYMHIPIVLILFGLKVCYRSTKNRDKNCIFILVDAITINRKTYELILNFDSFSNFHTIVLVLLA